MFYVLHFILICTKSLVLNVIERNKFQLETRIYVNLIHFSKREKSKLPHITEGQGKATTIFFIYIFVQKSDLTKIVRIYREASRCSQTAGKIVKLPE